MIQFNGGWTFGGQAYSEIIFFENETDLDHFTNGNFELSIDADIVALTAAARTSVSTMGFEGLRLGCTVDHQLLWTPAKYVKGTKVFVMPLGGLMYEATVGFQKFIYIPLKESSNQIEKEETPTEVHQDTPTLVISTNGTIHQSANVSPAA